MEEPQEPGAGVGVGVEAPFSFPPHRRSHLRSGTYRNLVRFISLCYGDSPLATAPPIIPLPQTPDNGSNRGELGGDDVGEPGGREAGKMQAQEGEVVDGGFDGDVLRDKGFSDTQMVIDEIENIMQVEEDLDLSNQNDLMVNSSADGTGFQDGEIGRGQMLMTELENIMKGNEECDKSSNCLNLLDQTQGNNCVDVSMNNQEELNDQPFLVLEESGNVGLPQGGLENGNHNIIESFGFSSNGSLTVEVSKSSENVGNQSSSSMTNKMHEKIESRQKQMELERFACSSDRLPSPDQMVEGGELEEGEIFGDIQLVNESIDMILNDAVVPEKKVEEKLGSVGTFDDKHLQCNEQMTTNNKDSEFTSFNTNAQIASGVTEGKLEGSERDQMVFELGRKNPKRRKKSSKKNRKEGKLGRMHRKEGSEKILKQSGGKNQVIKSKKEHDDGVCTRTRHNPSPAYKKEKEKENTRKKRAEKNQQLGVKRLKLPIVLNPKPVIYCRHYLMGRCLEGEKCNFSHDTEPLTKSQPCKHFARNSCLKGDDCPFDHQLSKYPCDNYKTKGFCDRGDDCLFSHKMSAEGDVASLTNAHELPVKPSLQGDSGMGLNVNRASHKNVDASSCSVGALSQKGKRQIVEETSTKTSDLARNNVGSLFVSKPTVAEAIKLYQGNSSQKMNEGRRFGIQSKQSTSGVNSPSASKPSLAESSKFNLGSSSLKMNQSSRHWFQANQSESGTIQNVNDSPKRRPEVVPRGINFLSFGKSSLEGNKGQLSHQTTQSTLSTDQKRANPAQLPLGTNLISLGKPGNSGSNALASLLSNLDNVNNGSLLNSNHAADKQHNSSAISYKLPVTSQTSGQSSERSAHKNTPNSAQEALVSTLAVAKMLDKGKSVHESQSLSDKQYNSNANPWKMPASSFSTGQFSEKMTHKSSPNSAQKALMSTLAFAAKFESGMKKSQSSVVTGVNSQLKDSRSGEGSKNDLSKTSKLLDILLSVGSKINQK
ncbi:hypothetical protein PTKIN_Ptkin19aG0078600 [Pterospermum kingtungense]